MEWLLSLTLLVGIIGCIYLLLKRHYSYWAVRNIPHRKPVFGLGDMSGLGSKYHWKDINRIVYEQFKGTAPFVGFYIFMTKAAFILDLDLIKTIMVKDFGSFADRGLFHNTRDDPLTGNLLFVDGEQWRTLRHKLSPVFTSGKIKHMFPMIVEIGERLAERCRKLTLESGGLVEAKDLCALYTTDVIGVCAFGIECNSLQFPDCEFRRMGREIFGNPRHSAVVQSFMFTDPNLARKLRMKNFQDDVSRFFINAVKNTVEYREQNNVKRKDFMDMLIELKAQRDRLGEAECADDMSNGLTLLQVAAQAMMFFLAGFDTSSTTMSFCMYELALNQHVQQKLRDEILKVLEKHDGKLTYESIKEMTYLDKVISETLRMYPVLPHLVRNATCDYQVPDTDIVFPKGLRVMLPVEAIHYDEEYYPDPEKFNPERFAPDEVAKRHPFAYLPFGDGPRNCIGMRFGKLQAQIGVVKLVSNFKITTTERTQIPPITAKDNFLIAAEGGIHLKLERL